MRLTAGEVVLEVRSGRWTRLCVAGLELLTAVREPGGWEPMLSGCFAMAPWAGRLSPASAPGLPAPWGGRPIHGLVLDAAWQQSGALLTAQVGPPWPGRATVTQSLQLHPDRLEAVLSLQAHDPMPAVLGWHPWFARRLSRGGPGRLEVSGGLQWQRGPDGLPTGDLVVPQPGPWDDCFRDLESVAVVWPGALRLVVTSTGRDWVLFDERPDALCVEPQTGPPDALRLGQAAALAAGEVLQLRTTWSWWRP